MSSSGTSCGTPLYSETVGQGPVLVLLHGWAMNLRVFDALRTELAEHYTVTCIDLPGHGRSPWPAHWTAAQQLSLIAAQLPAGATLAGWSLGGQLALQLAAELQGRLQRLVLIASTPRFVSGDDWPHGLPPATLAHFAAELASDPARTVADFLELQVRGSRGAAQIVRTLRGALEQHGMAQPAALRAGLALLATNDLRERSRGIRVPALLIAGQYDRVTPPGAARALAALLPQAQLCELPRAGHAPFLSHREAVRDAIVQLLHMRTA